MSGDSGLWPHLANRHHILVWADRIDASPNLPRLVRQLVDQTNDQVLELQMRADEGVRLRGYDGFSRAGRATPFVPEGAAVWEMGTDQDPERKANDDYTKRSEKPLWVKREETTFVFVTPRSWPRKTDWANEKRSEGVWTNVVALDVDDIDQAFEKAAAARIWFSGVAGLPVHGAQSLTQWWAKFSQLSSPPLSPSLVLAGRADAAAQLLGILQGPTKVTTFSANNEEELLAFVAAVVLSVPDDDQVRVLNTRSIIVRDAYAIQQLEHSADALILVPYFDELRRDARLVQGHHVVIRAEEGGAATVSLPPVDIAEFQSLLKAVGVPDQRAWDLARLARRSIYAFQRATPIAQVAAPPWVGELDSTVARRGWLVGRWNERRSGDIDALSALFEVPYDDARPEVVRLAAGADPLFVRVGDSWTVTSLNDAWQFGRVRLELPDLSAFETLIQTVLGSVDPRLELPVADRWMAGVHGKTPIHSGDIRHGVAEVLALVGARGEDVSIGSGTVHAWLYGVLHRLFARLNDDLTGHLWASLADVMPLLAEAGPDVFLQAVETGLDGQQPLLRMLFADNDDSHVLSVSSPHTGLLWALEGLAWSSEHFGQVVELLARLTEVDPGGRLSNRPAASLASVFRPWFPQTAVNADRRLVVLDVMRRRHPDVAWKLMLSMLPDMHSVAFHTHRPKFREWPSEPESLTIGEVQEMYIAVAERSIDDADTDPDRWVDLIGHLDDLPDPVFPQAVDALRRLTSDHSESRLRVWEPLRDLVMKHQRFAHAKWALDADQVVQLDDLQRAIAPNDPVERVRWLFDEGTPDLPEHSGPDFDAGRFLEAIDERRIEAVRTLFDSAGADAVMRLAGIVQMPYAVGDAVAKADLNDVGTLLFNHLDQEDEWTQAARSWTSQRARSQGWAWVEPTVDSLEGRPLAQARVLLESLDLERAWGRAQQDVAVDAAYWAEFSPYGRGQAFELAERAAAELLAHDRPRAALMLMNLYAAETGIDPSLVMDALERLARMPEGHPDQFRIGSFEIERLLDYLRSVEVDEDRLMMLEWQLRPALRFGANSPVLERRLARDPKFFVEVLSMSFKPRHGEPDPNIPEHVARNAYQLLDDWSVVPGATGSGQPVDAQGLNKWIDEAIPLLQAADREGIGLEMIGKVFAKAPTDPDETWPTRPVRDLLERLRRSEVDRGLEIEVFNSRGVTSRGLADGGDQERALATKYETLAQKVSDEWPRTATILRSIASAYDHEARQHDEEAQRFLEGLDR